MYVAGSEYFYDWDCYTCEESAPSCSFLNFLQQTLPSTKTKTEWSNSIDSIKHIVSQVGGHPVTFPVAAEIRHSVTLTTAQHFPVLHWMQFLSFSSLHFSLPSFPFSPETPDTQASRNYKSTQSLKHTFSLIVTPLNSNLFCSFCSAFFFLVEKRVIDLPKRKEIVTPRWTFDRLKRATRIAQVSEKISFS